MISRASDVTHDHLYMWLSDPYEKEILKKFNCTILFVKYYILLYISKMHNQAIQLSVFVNKVLFKYRIEKYDY